MQRLQTLLHREYKIVRYEACRIIQSIDFQKEIQVTDGSRIELINLLHFFMTWKFYVNIIWSLCQYLCISVYFLYFRRKPFLSVTSKLTKRRVLIFVASLKRRMVQELSMLYHPSLFSLPTYRILLQFWSLCLVII